MNTTTPAEVPPPLPHAQPAKPVQGLAIASLALGLLSVVGGAFLLVPPILAVIFGHIALSRTGKDSPLGGRGLAIVGLVTGYLGFVILSIGLLAAMAIPAFQKVRENSYTAMMRNDARQIAAAAETEMLENPGAPVEFHIDPATGEVSGPLAKHVHVVSKGIQEVDGIIENEQDGFSLRHPQVKRGKPLRFSVTGVPLD
jgi:Domain of unknown function (DUF4190)